MAHTTEEFIARIAYEVNRGYSKALNNYEPPWHVTPPEVKQSYVDGVKFYLTNPNASPDLQHEAWLKTKRAAGWKWGEVKSLHNKTHPALLEYAQLPLATRAKDHIFQAVVNAFHSEDGEAQPPEEGTSDVKSVEPADTIDAGSRDSEAAEDDSN